MPATPPPEVQALMPKPILGKAIQVCMITSDHRAMMQRFVDLGIGPWEVLEMGTPEIENALYYGRPHHFRCIRALAFMDGFVWEILEPLEGESVIHDHLEKHGDSVHHLGMLHRTDDFDGAIHGFEALGYQVAQSGLWDGKLRYAFLNTDAALGAFIELWDKPADFTEPKPDSWFPAPAA